MSAHFAVLREAELIEASKIGTSILYQLKLSVLEDALLGFTQLFGIGTGERTAVGSASTAPLKKARKGVDR